MCLQGMGFQDVVTVAEAHPAQTVVVTQITAGVAAVNAVQTVTIGGTPAGGTFKLTYGSVSTADLPYNESTANVQAALRALSSINGANVTVTGTAGASYVVTFGGALAGRPVSPITASHNLTGGTNPSATVAQTTAGVTAVNEVQKVELPGTPSSGTFTLTYSGQTTAALPYNATAAQVQTALRAISSINGANVSVTGIGGVEGISGGPYTVTFIGTLAGAPLADMTGTATALDDVDAYEHTLTMGAMSDMPYMTVLHSIGDGAAKFERRATDARVEMLRIDAGSRGSLITFSGFGLREDTALGTEEAVNESDAMMLPSKGRATVTVDGLAFTAPFRGFRMLVSNPLSRTEQQMFSLEHDDLPPTGFDINGTLMQLDVDFPTYKLMEWGGLTGDGPDAAPVRGSLNIKFEGTEIAGSTLPYSVEIDIPSLDLRMGQFEARGRNLIRFDMAFMMVDDVLTPITIKVINTKSTFGTA